MRKGNGESHIAKCKLGERKREERGGGDTIGLSDCGREMTHHGTPELAVMSL